MKDQNISLWRATIKTGSQDGKSFEFCLQNQILGVGWCLRDSNGQPYTPASIEECERRGREQYHSSRGFVVSIHALKEMAVDDLVWTRHNGVYYLCRVLSTWKYNCDAAHVYEDEINYVDAEFHEIGTVERIPGGVVNCFRASAALQKIKSDAQLRYAEHLYRTVTGTQFYPDCAVKKEEILDFLQPEDVEEAVSLYLQVEKGYLIYSSTNKLDTQTYEFVAVAKDGSHKAYPQVKTGNAPLDGNDYRELTAAGNKVFLFTIHGAYRNTAGMDIIERQSLYTGIRISCPEESGSGFCDRSMDKTSAAGHFGLRRWFRRVRFCGNSADFQQRSFAQTWGPKKRITHSSCPALGVH